MSVETKKMEEVSFWFSEYTQVCIRSTPNKMELNKKVILLLMVKPAISIQINNILQS